MFIGVSLYLDGVLWGNVTSSSSATNWLSQSQATKLNIHAHPRQLYVLEFQNSIANHNILSAS
jgi:hypothetical protein